MRPEGVSEAAPGTLDLEPLPKSAFSKPLAPLYEHRRRVLALDGLSLAGIPHQRLLVSVARAMGLDVDRVGLGYARGQRGDHIDLIGPLAGLRA